MIGRQVIKNGKEKELMIFIRKYDSPLGRMTIAAEYVPDAAAHAPDAAGALIGLWFDGQKHFGSVLEESAGETGESGDAAENGKAPAVIDETVRWLDIYFSGKDPGFTPKLKFIGTDFRKKVWESLLTVPYGRTVTYAEIAGKLGKGPAAARSIGGAVGHNPISLIVPCHRVVGADGSLTGYAGGIERKAALLELEQGGRAGRLHKDIRG